MTETNEPKRMSPLVGHGLPLTRKLDEGLELFNQNRREVPNTYLNELTRAEYREIFGVHFEILEVRVAQPDLGPAYFDARAQAELADWPNDDLFSNQTLFVLRPRTFGDR